MRIRLSAIALTVLAAVFGAVLLTSVGAGGQQDAGGHCAPAGTSGPAFTDTAVPYPIPDQGEVNGCFTIDDPGIINQVNVGLGITHTYVGDLIVTLTHEDTGRSVTLLDRPPNGGMSGCSGDDISIVLTDPASTSVEDKCNTPGPPAISGTWRPVEPLSAFIGEAIAGTWTLSVSDNAAGDDGTLDSWTLITTLKDPACDPAGISGPAFTDTLVPYPIPERGEGKARACFTIDNPGIINQVNVGLGITHTYVGDLIVTLTHKDTGTSVTLIDRPGGGNCSGDDISIVLTDPAAASVEDKCNVGPPAISGTWRPVEPLSAFNGEGIAGTWTLIVSDNFGGDIGTLDSWTIIAAELKTPTPTPTSTATATATATPTSMATATATATATSTATSPAPATATPTSPAPATPTPTSPAPATATPTSLVPPTNTPVPEKPCGDVNDDGSVTSVDALLILQLVVGLLDSVPNPDSANVNSDSQIDSLDALLILQLGVGLLDMLDCP